MSEAIDVFHDEDDDGAATLADCAVLFLDLLGTAGPRGDTEVLQHLRQTQAAVVTARDLIGENDQQDSFQRMTWFSDNLNLFYAATEEGGGSQALHRLVHDVAFLQLGFTLEGVFARGAIAFDQFYADAEFRYGPALDRAVLLERSRARYPRIILDESSIATIRRATEDDEREPALLIVDEDVVFVDYLELLRSNDDLDTEIRILTTHAGLIEDGLRRFDGITGIEEKYRWLAGYHNYCVSRAEPDLGEQADELRTQCSRPLGTFSAF